MSARNGDKSRFNRERKQKIAKRKRTRELVKRAAAERKSLDTMSARSHGRCRHEHPAASGVTQLGAHPRCSQKEASAAGRQIARDVRLAC